MANSTYYVSYNGSNFSLKDSNGNATTSVSTTTNYVEKINLADTILDHKYYTYTIENLYVSNIADVTSTLSDGESYFQFNGDSLTVGLSLESVSHSTTYYTASVTTATFSGYKDVNPEQTFTLESNSLKTYYRLYSYDSSTYAMSVMDVTGTSGQLVSSTAGGAAITLFKYSMPLELSVNALYNGTYTTYAVNSLSTSTYNTGLLFSSTTSSNGNIVYHSTSLVVTTRATSFTSTYAGNPYVVSKETSSAAWRTAVKVLKPSVTSQTGWTTVTSNYANTTSTLGLVVDEDGNVAYGSVSGLGAIVPLDNSNYRPGVITAFSKSADVDTIDTSWFATFTTRKSASGTSSTADTYIEFNNYGVGGTISSSTYTWNTFTSTITSERSYDAYVNRINFDTQGVWIYKTLTAVDVYSGNAIVSDNSCSFMSSSKYATYNNALYVSYVIDSITSVAEEITSQETSRTRTIEFTTWNWKYTLSGYNTYLSITDTLSSTTSWSSMVTSTTYLEVTETTYCDITSYTDQHGYYYYTTFYGELGNETFYATSWVNSAVVVSDVSDYIDGLTRYTVEYITSAFGDIVNSTTIVEENILSSIVNTTSSVERVVSELKVSSSTSSSINAPREYFTTKYTSWKNSTVFSTYMGPDISWNGVGLDTFYNFSVTVTSVGSFSDYDYVSSQMITSSVLNTSDYGTTYRLSELISSSSWFNIGNVNGTVNYRYSYYVDSMFSYDSFISNFSTYTTVLYTTFAVSYNTVTEAVSYSFTATQSNTVKTTGERFIDKIEIYRTSTVGVYGRNTVAVFSGSTLDTISSHVTTESAISTSQDVSTVDRTFITSTADFITNTELVTQDTLSSVSNRFISSSSFMISSTYEQQDETLMFKSSWNKYSYYYNTSYYSTVDTIKLTISASTYESLYVPASFTTTSGSTSRSSTTGSYSSSTLVTSVSSYTTTWMPVYTTVDGVYVTTE